MGFDFYPFSLVQSVSKADNNLSFFSSVAHTMYWYTLIRFPLNLFFSRLSSPISLSLSTYLEDAPVSYLSLWLDSLQSLHNFLMLGSPELDGVLQLWSQQCWEGMDHLPQTAGITFFNETQEAVCLFYCAGAFLMFNLVSSRSLMPFLPKLLPGQSASSSCWCMELCLPRYKTFHFSLLNLIRCPQVNSLAWKGSSEWHKHLVYQLLPLLSFVLSCKLAEGKLFHHPVY